jgi:hypothetical protein
VATVKQAIHENDVVELLHPTGGWAAGTRGTVVSERDEHMLIEISDEHGQMLDLVSLTEPQLKLIAKYSE